MFSDRELRRLIASGRLCIDPFREEQLRPVGIRLHLASEILIPRPGQIVNPASDAGIDYESKRIDRDTYLLEPGDFVLGATCERIRADAGLICRLEGRSTIARLGLTVHCSSGVIDGIHESARAPVLELANIGTFRILLSAFLPIGMLVVEALRGTIDSKPQVQYADQIGVRPPNLAFRTPAL